MENALEPPKLPHLKLPSLKTTIISIVVIIVALIIAASLYFYNTVAMVAPASGEGQIIVKSASALAMVTATPTPKGCHYEAVIKEKYVFFPREDPSECSRGLLETYFVTIRDKLSKKLTESFGVDGEVIVKNIVTAFGE